MGVPDPDAAASGSGGGSFHLGSLSLNSSNKVRKRQAVLWELCSLTSLYPFLLPLALLFPWSQSGSPSEKNLNPEPCGPEGTKDCPSLVHIGVLLTPPLLPATANSRPHLPRPTHPPPHPLHLPAHTSNLALSPRLLLHPYSTVLCSAESFRVHVKVKQMQCLQVPGWRGRSCWLDSSFCCCCCYCCRRPSSRCCHRTPSFSAACSELVWLVQLQG